MAIFVIGMHRSGTSMVASILQSLGVNLGPDELLAPANQFNEAGYFENAPAVATNDAFLKENDLSWRTLPAIETKTTLQGVETLAASIQDVIKSLNTGRAWCLKDPRLSYLLPYWASAVKPASAIVCVRKPEAAAMSLKTRNDISISYGAALWELYTLAALRNTQKLPRAIVVYEELIEKPKETIEKMIASLPELAELKPGANAIEAAVARVRRELDHSKPISAKALPPTALELYRRLAAGKLDISKQDEERGLAFEIVRLEAERQSATRLNNEAREQLTRVGKNLGDIAGLIATPGESAPVNMDAQFERLREFVRKRPANGVPAIEGEAARAKDDRIELLRQELGATGARAQTILDSSTALQIELARLRAESEPHGEVTAINTSEVGRLATEGHRLHALLIKTEEDRAGLLQERSRVKSEYEIALTRLNAERAIVAETMDNLRARIDEKEALIARMKTERLEEEVVATGLKRISGERETLLANLSRATQMLDLRNKELANLSAREHDLGQRSYELNADIDKLQRDLNKYRMREANFASTLSARDQSEVALHTTTSRQIAATPEIERQLLAARETIEMLETELGRRGKAVDELEAQQLNDRRLLLEYEVRIPILEEAAVERAQLSARNAQLKEEIQRIITERDRAYEKHRTVVANLEAQVRTLTEQKAQAVAETQAALARRDEEIARLKQTVAGTASGSTEGERRLQAENAELTRALQSARDRTEQMQRELQSKRTGEAANRTTPASDQRLRRQLLALNELLATIDKLLSPKYGRFTIPVRQIRVQLTQARQIVDGEVAMTRR